MAKEKYYKDNISGNHNKDSAKWWKKIKKLTRRDKSNNFSVTDPESQSIMNDKDTANYRVSQKKRSPTSNFDYSKMT